jgi:hypothetical protein
MAAVPRAGQFPDMRQGITAGLIALVASLAAAAPALGETYLVQGTGDSASPPACTPFQPGVLTCTTLRGAVNEANADADVDAIVVTPGTYTLSQGELELRNDVGFSGGGARTTHLVAGSGSRVLAIDGADVTVSALEIRGGAVPGGEAGGNIEIASGSSLSLTLVRVSGGAADQGAGISNAGTLVTLNSLFDGNIARFVGGAIWNLGGSLSGASTTLTNTTLAGNGANVGGAIRSEGSASNQLHLRHVTIGRNFGGGISFGAAHPATATASILASNVEENCDGAQFSSGSWNVSSDESCGLTATTNRQNIDPGLAGGLTNQGGTTDVLTIPAASAAVDLVTPCELLTDQRSFQRFAAAGEACDAGAYEQSATGPAGEGPPPVETPPAQAPTEQPPAPALTPAQDPLPVFQQTVVAKPVSGTVRVRRRGSKDFVVLPAGAAIPLGSSVDTKKGAVEILAVPKAGAAPERATFRDGIFRITFARGITSLTLTEKLAACKRGASAAAKKPKQRRLWGDGRGSFRTVGRYSAATVRGTKWLVRDTCAGTLTRVTEGAVLVTHGRKRIILRKGKRYLARPR